ncbi:hypothetical protein JCM6882_005812 [Rhodosporidiobolus microsporus]
MAGVVPAQNALRDHLASLPEYSTPKIQFYYSSLPPKKLSNPTGYSAALNWWRRTLVDLVEKGLVGDDKLVLTVDEELREKLRWDKVGRPSSLGVIVAELALTADLIPLPTYLSSPLPPSSDGESSFSVVSLLARPFWWGLSKVWGAGEEKVELGEKADENEWKRRKGEWVVPDLVEKSASSLLPHLASLHSDALSRLYTLKTFRDKLGPLCLPNVTLSEQDCEVLARFLEAKGECTFDGEVIKFSPPHSSASPAAITPSDRSTLSLLSTLASLTGYITSLESRIAAEQALVSKYAVGESKNLPLAKSHLRARKRVEKLLEERVGARDKVQEVVWGIERAVGDEETLTALSLGTSTLRSILSSPTLQLSNIEATTSALDSALIDAQEVNQAVDAVSAPMVGEVEDEVEEELRALVEEERGREEREREREVERKLAEGGKVPEGKLEQTEKEKTEEKVVDKAEKLVA